jgi:hypothetical protein
MLLFLCCIRNKDLPQILRQAQYRNTEKENEEVALQLLLATDCTDCTDFSIIGFEE